MKGKKVFSVLAVAMLAFCAIFVAAADSEAGADDVKEKTTLIDFEKSDYKKLSKVTEYPVNKIIGAFEISVSDLDENFDKVVELKNVTYSKGASAAAGNTTLFLDELYIISAEFTIKLVAKHDDASITSNGTYDEYFYSDVLNDYVSNLSKSFEKDEVIELTGTIKTEYYHGLVQDCYKNKSYEYLLTGALEEKKTLIELNGTAKFKGNTYNIDVKKIEKNRLIVIMILTKIPMR